MARKCLHILIIFISSTVVADLYKTDGRQIPFVEGSNIVDMLKSSGHSFQLNSFDEQVKVEVEGVQSQADWPRIDDINDPEVVNIATVAVGQYNKQTGTTNLSFEQIIKGGKRVEAGGTTYKMVVTSKDYNTGSIQDYEATVYVNTQGIIKLLSFTAVQD